MRELKWKAHYNDGTILPQYNEDGTENGYHSIERNRLSHFVLYDENDKAVFSVRLNPDQRLIYRRRTAMRGSVAQGLVYLVGWQMTIKGKNIKSIAYIFDDGAVELDNDRSDLDLLPFEI